MAQANNKCEHLLTGGKRRGQPCYEPCEGKYCTKHEKYHTEEMASPGYEPGNPHAAVERSQRRGVEFELQMSKPRWTAADMALFGELRKLRDSRDALRKAHANKAYRVEHKRVILADESDGDHFRRGERKYADPLVAGAWIYIDERAYQALLLDETKSFVMVSDTFKRQIKNQLLKLSVLKHPVCIDCGEDLMTTKQREKWAFDTGIKYLSARLRLPGDPGRTAMLEPPVSHPDCFHQVVAHTDIVAAYAEAVKQSDGDEKKMAKALANLQKAAERAWRSALEDIKPKVPDLTRDEVKRRARAILNRLSEQMEASNARPR